MGYKKNYNSLLPDDFVLSEEFETIVEQLENTKDHFYITGKAGSGKSTLLAYFRSVTQKNTAVLAPTGVAAIRVKGQTIHSFFGFPPKVIQTRHIKKLSFPSNSSRSYIQKGTVKECFQMIKEVLDGL